MNSKNFRSFITGDDVTRIVIGFLIAHILTNLVNKINIGEQFEDKNYDIEKIGKAILYAMLEMYGVYIFYKVIMYIRPHEPSEIYLKTNKTNT